ncbi:GH15 family glucan-1,4-alpha-glucosidase [Kitasatospora sp. GAS204A]|nr:GH15 family glucan-1,4-alpha-glucosidase [Kitasatospora sp. GAS204B]
MSAYPAIADHGMPGDFQSAALMSSDGTIDWWCAPRFDSPSVFASLLDSERGGYCRLSAHLPGGQEPVVVAAAIALDEQLDRAERGDADV